MTKVTNDKGDLFKMVIMFVQNQFSLWCLY